MAAQVKPEPQPTARARFAAKVEPEPHAAASQTAAFSDTFDEALRDLKAHDGGQATFGSVGWPSRRRTTIAKWVCLSTTTTTAPQLMDLMLGPWRMRLPSAVISLVENPEPLPDKDEKPLTESQLLQLTHGVVKAAELSSAWMVTQGVHPLDDEGDSETSDASAEISKALSSSSIPCIGIAPAGRVAEASIMKQLMPGHIHRYGDNSSSSTAGGGMRRRASLQKSPNVAESDAPPEVANLALDDSLSHIILCDDGTTSLNSSVSLRLAWENHVSTVDFSNDGTVRVAALLAACWLYPYLVSLPASLFAPS